MKGKITLDFYSDSGIVNLPCSHNHYVNSLFALVLCFWKLWKYEFQSVQSHEVFSDSTLF